jgi:hypothetical protein
MCVRCNDSSDVAFLFSLFISKVVLSKGLRRNTYSAKQTADILSHSSLQPETCGPRGLGLAPLLGTLRISNTGRLRNGPVGSTAYRSRAVVGKTDLLFAGREEQFHRRFEGTLTQMAVHPTGWCIGLNATAAAGCGQSAKPGGITLWSITLGLSILPDQAHLWINHTWGWLGVAKCSTGLFTPSLLPLPCIESTV